MVLEYDLPRRMVKAHCRQPAAVGRCPALLAGMDAAVARARRPCRCCRALPTTRMAVARARTRSRIASCAGLIARNAGDACQRPVSLPACGCDPGGWNCAPVADLAAMLSLCERDRCRRLVDIRPDEHAIPHSVFPPILAARHQPIRCNPRTENAAGEATDPVSSQPAHGVQERSRIAARSSICSDEGGLAA